MDYINPSGYERTQVALSCPRLPNAHGPMPLNELKTFITPRAAELKKATEGKAMGDPAVPLEEQKAAIDALGADCTFQDLEDCLPDKVKLSCIVKLRAYLANALQGHPAMLTIRRAGNHPREIGEDLSDKYALLGPISSHKLLQEMFTDKITEKTRLEDWIERQAHRYEKLAQRNGVFPLLLSVH